MANIRLEPTSSHTIKYSQPFKLVLFTSYMLELHALKAPTTCIY